jgi:predicted metal-binding protein
MSEVLKPKTEVHVFVCTNAREAGHPRGCCKSKGSETLLEKLKFEAKKQGFGLRVRIQKSGCLDVCESGVALAIYPKKKFLGKVLEADIPDILEAIRRDLESQVEMPS